MPIVHPYPSENTRAGRARRVRARVRSLAIFLALAGPILTSPIKPTEARAEASRSLILATTTSVRDSGLLDALLPPFTRKTGIDVRVIAVGTGAALRMGREGNADLLLTHAPGAEEELVRDGIVRKRNPFMQNFFVIAGPPGDPAGIANATDAKAAIAQIARRRAPWVSRADDSGTHKREVSLFEAAGLDPRAVWEGFVRTGSGMGLSLQVAGEKQAYILSDIGTFLAFEKRVGLQSYSGPSDELRNVYSVLLLDDSKFEHPLEVREAEALEQYLLAPTTLEKIADFGRERFGRALFQPIRPTSATAPASEDAREPLP